MAAPLPKKQANNKAIVSRIENKLGPVGPGHHNSHRTNALMEWLKKKEAEKKGTPAKGKPPTGAAPTGKTTNAPQPTSSAEPKFGTPEWRAKYQKKGTGNG